MISRGVLPNSHCASLAVSAVVAVHLRCAVIMRCPRAMQAHLAGAGKTTLVDRILTAQHGFRVAVILNEIGDEKGIEKALLQDETGAPVHN